MRKKILLVLLILILIVNACEQKQNVGQEYDEEILRVGVITPLSGFLSVLGDRTRAVHYNQCVLLLRNNSLIR